MDSRPEFTGPVNVGKPVETIALDLAVRVVRLLGGLSRIEYRPLPQDDPRQQVPDTSLVGNALDWEHRVTLVGELKETVGYFRKRLEA
jgi:UDP-glucuronate decarboxylase